jgi:hypothetical protein
MTMKNLSQKLAVSKVTVSNFLLKKEEKNITSWGPFCPNHQN